MGFLVDIGMAFKHGGFWMFPILLFHIVSIAIIVERGVALFKKRKPDQAAVAAQFEDNIKRGEMGAVLQKARAAVAAQPLAGAVVAGAEAAVNFGGKDEIQGKMDEVLLHENAQLERRIGFLAMLGNVATLTGLLGTISGMIKSFAAVAMASPAEKATILSAGISEAMNCTAYGLIVAIPSLVFYAILQNRANLLAEDLNQSALKVYNWLSYSFDPISAKTSAKAGQKHSSESRELNA